MEFHPEVLNSRLRAIHERAIARAQNYLRSETDLLESIIEVDQHKLYEKFGLAYLTTYCVKHLGLPEVIAGVLVRVARKCQQVPELRTAVADGEVSISNARTIAAVINRGNQGEWLMKAKTLSKAKLEREVAIAAPAQAKPEKARHIGNGRMQIVLNLSEEEYSRRCRIKDLVSQSLGKNASEEDTEIAMMNCYQFHKDPVKKAERAARRKEQNTSRDASLSTQIIVDLRDQRKCHARNPDGTVCGETRWLHYHHILPKERGGKDTPENIITLCSAHHRLWHKRNGS